MLTTIEAWITKGSGVPLQTVITRCGLYLNLLGPLTFFVMMVRLTDWKKALAAALSYLFLASGMLPCYYTATYSPWAFPNCFILFVFFLNVTLCYQALRTEKYAWFAVLGFFLGISFLGHTSPTVLLLLILISVQTGRMFRAFKSRNYPLLRKQFLQGVVAFVPFLLLSFPLLYYIVGKYHMHVRNMAPFEYVDTIFIWRNWREMISANLSVTLLVAITGFFWFIRNEQDQLVRKIFLRWGIFAVIMYVYSSMVAGLDRNFHIRLPGTVPSFHYFVYLKALESVFFGYGLFFLSSFFSGRLRRFFHKAKPAADYFYRELIYVLMIVVIAGIYYPVYQKRPDFHFLRSEAIRYQNDSTAISAYHYIMDHIPADNVILCGEHHSFFPVMATARKMVSIGITFSNPYLDFQSRESDRNKMLTELSSENPQTAERLLNRYNVSYVLTDYKELPPGEAPSPLLGKPVFQNSVFRIFKVNKRTTGERSKGRRENNSIIQLPNH